MTELNKIASDLRESLASIELGAPDARYKVYDALRLIASAGTDWDGYPVHGNLQAMRVGWSLERFGECRFLLIDLNEVYPGAVWIEGVLPSDKVGLGAYLALRTKLLEAQASAAVEAGQSCLTSDQLAEALVECLKVGMRLVDDDDGAWH